MSYDLGVFFTQRPLSADDAMERYSAYCSGDFAHFLEPSPSIERFLKDLTDRYPQIDDVTEDQLDDCPWSIAFDVSDGHVLMPMVHSKADEVAPFVVTLAGRHGLVCVDPQDGRVLSAPDGLLVAETEPTAEELEAETKRPDSAMLAAIDQILEPRGFVKNRRVWRKDGPHAISAVQAGGIDGIFEAAFCFWSKEEGDEAAPHEVKPNGGRCHMAERLDGQLLPERLLFRWMRAAHLECDYADFALEIYVDTNEDARRIASYFEPREPLTTKWRVATLREVFEGYVLPFFDRVDAREHRAMLAEQAAKEKQERDQAWQETLDEWTPVIAMCRDLQESGSDHKTIVGEVRAALRDCPSEAVVLSIALGWTMAEARQRMEAAGRSWDSLTEDFIELLFEENDELALLPDGRAELRD